MIKVYATITGLLLVIGGVWGFWNTVHTAPMRELTALTIKQRDTIAKDKIKINNLDLNLTVCKKGAEASDFQSYFEGGGGIEKNSTSDNGNIFLKRMSE